ncbi:MAG: chorismate mutase [Anaerolineaceae bacterium]|nr:MAG: chorismate mutase [Anaerolineaceae bacterium]
MVYVRGVRGATTVDADDENAILSATHDLLQAIIDANDIREDDVASIFFTTTPDLSAAHPARAARERTGWHSVALMGAKEMVVPGGVARCIRVLIHWNTDKAPQAIRHIYQNDAVRLRPDRQN